MTTPIEASAPMATETHGDHPMGDEEPGHCQTTSGSSEQVFLDLQVTKQHATFDRIIDEAEQELEEMFKSFGQSPKDQEEGEANEEVRDLGVEG